MRGPAYGAPDRLPLRLGPFGYCGIDEFVLYWPQSWREAPSEDAVFEEVATTVIPRLRAPQ